MENENTMQVNENTLAPIAKNEVMALIKTASSLQLSKDESGSLIAPFEDDLIEIRPDGHIYLPQTYYRERLNEVLGIGQWTLIVKGFTEEASTTSIGDKKTKLFLNGLLVIRGCLVAEAVGEAEYFSTNANQSIASAWESAKSDCITRCCKDLSIATQVYKPTYMRQWQQENAIQVWVKDEKKPKWRRKNSQPFLGESGEAKKPDPIPGFPKHPFNNPHGNRPWLNHFNRQDGSETVEWIAAVKDIKEANKTVEAIENIYRLNKDVKAELDKIYAETHSGAIPGYWYARLEKCKTLLEVDQLAIKHQEDVKGNSQLYDLFKKYKRELSTNSEKVA